MKRFLIIVLFLLSLLSYSHASRGQYVSAMVTGSILGFGIGNFIVGHVEKGVGHLFVDVISIGLIMLWVYKDPILEKASDETPGPDNIATTKEGAKEGSKWVLISFGIIGTIALVISRVMQVVDAHKYYRDNIGFADYNNQLKHKYAQSRNVFENFDVGLMAVSFRKTL